MTRPLWLDVDCSRTRLREFFKSHGLRPSVVLICVISGAMLWAGLVAELNFEREYIIESERQDNDNLARVFEEHVARTVRAAEITLREIASEYRRDGGKFDLVHYAKDGGIYLDPYNILGISDENGNAVMASVPVFKPANYRDNDNNQYHARHDTRELFIGTPRIGTNTGKWTVYLSVRINKADGSFGGIAILGMDPAYFSKIYAELDLGKDATVTLIGRDGVTRARSSGAGVTAGDNMAGTPLFTRYLPAADHGNFIDAGSADKIKRISSYRALKDYPLVVLVGTSMAVALADYDKRRSTLLQAASGLTVVILCLGLFALFQIARSERESGQRRRGERLFRALADGSPVGIFRADAAGKSVYVNARWCEIAGTRPEAALGDGWASALHPDDRERVFGEWTAAANNRQPFLSEHRIRRPDGSITWVVAQARAETDPQGKVLGYVGTATDITERKRTEQALMEGERRYRELFEINPHPMYVHDLETLRFLAVNEAAVAQYGYSHQEFFGMTVKDIWPPEDVAVSMERLKSLPAGLVSGRFRRHRKKDGTFIEVEITSNTLEFMGHHTRIVLAIDVTERRRAEAARDQLATIVENANDAIFSRALDGIITSWNAGAERMFGYSAAEAIGRPAAFNLAPGRQSNLAQNTEIILRGEAIAPLESQRLTKDGRVIDVLTTLSPIRDSAGNVVAGSAILHDITALKEAEAELKRRTEIAQLLESLARTANEATNAETAMRDCLARICEYGGWVIGRLGIYGEQSDETVFPERSFWYSVDTSRYDEFMRASLDSRFYHPSGRFISRLLREKRPVWFSPVDGLTSTGRMAVAARQGLHCAFAFPVVLRDKVVAVLEFFAEEERPADTLLMENITNVSSQLARLVERGRAEETTARLAAIVENVNDAIVSCALDGTVLSWNPGAERMLGYTAAEMVGHNLSVVASKEELERHTARLLRGDVLPPFEVVRSTKNGRQIHLQISLSPIRGTAGNITAIASILSDTTERKRAEELQRASEVRVRELLRRLVEAQEGERRRFAADLHDVVGQNLSALEIELQRLRGAPPSGNGRNAGATLDNMARIVQDTTNSVRETIADLRPALLDDYGVFVAIEGYASRIERLTGLHISVQGNAPESRLPPRMELALFRMVQEALMNAVKHAAASRVTVELSRVGDVLRLCVEDDGKGIACSTPGLQRAGGWGIEFMSERAEALGGTLRVESPGVGTRVMVEIPLGNSNHPG
ncbi:MAG: hypothetical protein A3F74_21070 [Betaproteobacteria bacterium RIFCSPLOWO2_12_FULL_62_58]|nr:MAG: hypothetical protein A3F74_21070 [Betaproteobacteria bacterium RIFCSPLOWO2_12_FULL_62_58]